MTKNPPLFYATVGAICLMVALPIAAAIVDTDAEEAVIGSFLIDGTAIYKVATLLQPFDFYTERNSQIYGACLSLYQRNEAINQITLAQELDEAFGPDRAAAAGGIPLVALETLGGQVVPYVGLEAIAPHPQALGVEDA